MFVIWLGNTSFILKLDFENCNYTKENDQAHRGMSRNPDEMWEVTMRRMKEKVAYGLRQWDVKPWSVRIAGIRWGHAVRINAMGNNRWPKKCVEWDSAGINDLWLVKKLSRNRGRPYLRSDDTLSKYCKKKFEKRWYCVEGYVKLLRRIASAQVSFSP